MRRISIQVALLFLAGAVGVAVGCANGDSTNSSGTGGSSGQGTGGSTANGTGGATASGGTTGAGTGGSASGTGGEVSTGGSSATGGSPGTGGTTTSTGGSPGTGGATTSTGGVSGTGGSTSTGTGGSGSGTFGQPVCGNNSAGMAIAKSVACTSTDPQLCYKTCGPSGAGGVKSETCTNNAYMEMSGCSFNPANDYSCYKIPTTLSSMCPTTTPQANMACTVPTCTPCNLNGMYLDSSSAMKTGWCVCTSSGKWTCATTGTNSSWPCPGGTGC